MPSRGRDPRRVDRAARAAVERAVYAEETHCWLCGVVVDKSLPSHNPGSKTVDEIVPVIRGGSPVDRQNCRLAHWSCNSRRGDRSPKAIQVRASMGARPSRQW